MKLALAHGVLSGRPNSEDEDDDSSSSSRMEERLQSSLCKIIASGGEEGGDDQLNQYSPPCGRNDLRLGIVEYYQRFYNYSAFGAEDITVTLGATEALASALRIYGRPGDT